MNLLKMQLGKTILGRKAKISEDQSQYFLEEELLIMMEDMNKVVYPTIDEKFYLSQD